MTTSHRWRRHVVAAVLVASTGVFSWLAMQAVHEFGHVLHAWLSGGDVERVVLHPLVISRTDVALNPHPLFVTWGGPIWGALIPLGLWAAARRCRWRHTYLAAFFAGFCLIANGTYIGAGAWDPVGDAEALLNLGTPRWLLLGFGVPAACGGLWSWHGLGPHFGLRGGEPDVRAARLMVVAALVVIGAELLFWRLAGR